LRIDYVESYGNPQLDVGAAVLMPRSPILASLPEKTKASQKTCQDSL